MLDYFVHDDPAKGKKTKKRNMPIGNSGLVFGSISPRFFLENKFTLFDHKCHG